MRKALLAAVGIAATMALAVPAFATTVVQIPPSAAPLPPVPLMDVEADPADSDLVVLSSINNASDPLTVQVTAATDLYVNFVSLAINGTVVDLEKLEVALTTGFGGIVPVFVTPLGGGNGIGGAGFTDFYLSAGETIGFIIMSHTGETLGGASSGLSVNWSVSAVPVPAALPLTLGALGGLVAMRRRKAAA